MLKIKALTDGIKKAISVSENNEDYPNTFINAFAVILENYKNNSVYLPDAVFESLILDVIASYKAIQVTSKNNNQKLTALLEYIEQPKPEIDLKNDSEFETRKV